MSSKGITSQSTKLSGGVRRLTGGYIKVPKALLVWGVVFAFTVPIFRSGLQSHLTFAQWVLNHTIFGPPVEYIPREKYEEAFRKELD